MVKEIADAGHKVTLTSLTTGEEHSQEGGHYKGLAIDMDFEIPAVMAKVFELIYGERERLKINELIHGGNRPDGTHNLKRGEPYEYGQTTLDNHVGHMHVMVDAETPAAAPDQLVATPIEALIDPVPEVEQKLETQLEKVIPLRPAYEAAAAATEIDWRVLAALDYRESLNDPESSAWAGEPLGATNPDHGDIKPTDKTANLISASEHFKAMARAVYGLDITASSPLDDLALAALAYNRGNMYEKAGASVFESPYVLNGINEDHVEMKWPDSAAEPASTRGRRHLTLGFVPMLRTLQEKLPD